MRRTACSRLALVLFLTALAANSFAQEASDAFDVVVYGGTSGGVSAAVQTRRMGKTVVLIEPGKHLGGLTSGGLGATDIGNKAAIGGISREFYQRVKKYYSDPSRWVHEQQNPALMNRDEDAMWKFEPHVAEQIMNDFCREAGVVVVFQERLDLKRGVAKENGQIVSIRMESGRTFRGKRFIDATYEGDLMALAGVKYHVGREGYDAYQESLNGVQTKHAKYHQLVPGVDPYVRPGDPKSGLLPGVHADGPGEEGAGDRRVQAYNFRMCTTDVKENQIPWSKPEGYDPARYELLLRNFEAGENRTPWAPIMMPNRKTDVNNNFGFSTDNIGMNYDYPDGDYATRERIFKDHLLYQQGLMWTLVSNPRVPEKIRNEVARWGLAKDEFKETGGWPHQLYVREARRMVSDYVMTQHDCQGLRAAEDSVGLGAYNMDSHHTQRYVDANGHARNEGDVQVGVSPYPISYRSIVPKEAECSNLLVPVCLSASHISYGSIRMEPVFMVLGQSAATAACQSIDAGVAVQKVDYDKLKERLLADRQVLVWTGPKRTVVQGVDLKKLPGIVVDDEQAVKTGDWTPSSALGPFVGTGYIHDNAQERGQRKVAFTLPVKEAGQYEVRVAYTANGNRAKNVPVQIQHADGLATAAVNQQKSPDIDGLWTSVGKFRFEKQAVVTISNEGADGHVVVDAVQLLPVK